MHHGPELVVVATVASVLLLGLATRALSERVRLPYTVLVLLVGLLLGFGLPEHSVVVTGDQVSPDLILFVFLPILVFESSFSMQVHAVRRNIGPVLWLAGPALLLSTFGVAAWMVGVTAWTWAWGWVPALVFGALISATDPVAVVALLRELGAPKRLSVLIEGESLFNDGTAIVVFTLLLGVLTGQAEVGLLSTVGRFLFVAGGGVLVGGLFGVVTSAWLRRTFNQPVVEITLTLALAYLSMVVAESIHVSGVIAVVVAGLWMSGPGRVSISPEVLHFLHRFWEVLASIANTLIFFLVGLVVASAVEDAGLADFGVVAAAFVGIVALRMGLLHASRPVMNAVADPIAGGEASVMAWGGLRGAVSLALALMVAHEHDVPEAFRSEVLLVTAGVVFGTLVVNGTTIASLLAWLDYDKALASDRLAQAETRASILKKVQASIAAARQSPELRTVNWATVDEELAERRAEVQRVCTETENELAELPAGRDVGSWHQALSIERTAYWDAFAHGTLGGDAVQILDSDVDSRTYALVHGAFRPGATEIGRLPGWRGALERWLHKPGKTFGLERLQFDLVELRYELVRGRWAAAAAVLESLDQDEIQSEEVREIYRSWVFRSTELLEDFRANLPELTEALETRIARRISLNLEREAVSDLERQGAVDPDSARRARAEIEKRMKQLQSTARSVSLPDTAEVCRGAPLFAGLGEGELARIAELTTEKTLSPDEVLFEEGTTGGDLFIVARGAVAVLQENQGETRLLDILGSGDVLGEMELLTGRPRTATIKALTTCVVGEIDRAGFEALMTEIPSVAERVWRAFAAHRFDNHLRGLPTYATLSREDRMVWFDDGTMESLVDGAALDASGLVFVVSGALVGDVVHAAPKLLRIERNEKYVARGATRVIRLPERVL